MTLPRLSRAAFIFAFVVVAIGASARDAYASHFRYGTITWSINNPAQPNVVTIRFESAWRLSFGWGVTVNPGATIHGSRFAPIEIFRTTGGFSTSVQPNYQVTSVNPAEDWFTAVAQVTVTLPAQNAEYTVRFANCCRISTLLENNRDRDFIVTAGLTVRMPPQAINQPPTASTLPIIVLARNESASFPIPATDPNGDAITFSVPTGAQTGLVTTRPNGLSVSPTGVVTWTPTVNGLYAMQVRLADPHGAYTSVDVLLSVITAVGQPPVVLIDNVAAPKSITTVYGTPIGFNVRGFDPEMTPVLLTSGSLPPGANMSPSLPTTAVNASSTFNWTPSLSAIGSYVLNFAARDGHGRQSSQSVSLTITGNPPTISCLTSGNTIEATGPSGALFGVTANVDDAEGDALNVRFFIDGTEVTLSPATPPATVNFSHTVDLGNHTYEVRAIDVLGGTASCTGSFAIVDTTAPSITTPGDLSVDATSPAGAVVNFTTSATDIVDPNPALSCTPASGSTFSIGTTAVTCSATDASGNGNQASFNVDVNDITPPVITPNVAGTLGANGWYTSDVAVTFTVEDPESGIASSNGCSAQAVVADTAGVTFTCDATNGDGLSNSASVTIKRDATAPSVAFAVTTVVAEATSAAGAIINYDAATATDATSGLVSGVSCAPASGTQFALGASTVTCSATDAAGNVGQATLSVNVVDTTAPVFGAIDNIITPATSVSGATVNYAVPVARDVVDATPAVSCAPASGSTFPIGATLVTCTATDDASNTATATFSVSVTDTVPPVIGAVAPSTGQLWPPNHEMVPVMLSVQVTDNITVAPVCTITRVTSNEPDNGLGDGDTPVDWMITGPLTVDLRSERSGRGLGRVYTIDVSCSDAAGNSATSSAMVTVAKSQGR
jgi:hypothetical protein